jgi:hypothetical protein
MKQKSPRFAAAHLKNVIAFTLGGNEFVTKEIGNNEDEKGNYTTETHDFNLKNLSNKER